MKSMISALGIIAVLLVLAVAVWWYQSLAPEPLPESTTTRPTDSEMVEDIEAEGEEVPFGDDMIESVAPVTDGDTAGEVGGTMNVSIEDTGFSPATITVPVNTTVTFTNNGQGTHWPASDPHPSHTTLSGFDAARGLATGETYSYIFSKTGTWTYHDHLNPRLSGTVVVE